jgi:hypothetical protein
VLRPNNTERRRWAIESPSHAAGTPPEEIDRMPLPIVPAGSQRKASQRRKPVKMAPPQVEPFRLFQRVAWHSLGELHKGYILKLPPDDLAEVEDELSHRRYRLATNQLKPMLQLSLIRDGHGLI